MYFLLEISILSTIWFRNCSDSVVFFVFHFILEHKIDYDLSRAPWLNSGWWRGLCCSSICFLLWLIFVFCFVPKFVYVVRLLMLNNTWAISCFRSEVCGVRVFWYLFIFVPVYIFLLEEKLEDIKEEMQVLVWDWYKDVSICWLPLARFGTAQRCVYLMTVKLINYCVTYSRTYGFCNIFLLFRWLE